MAASVVAQVKEKYFLNISQDYADRVASATPMLTADQLYQRALRENMKQFAGASVLPYGAASQVAASLPNNVVLQISTSRDATQPLRPCADTSEEDALLNAAMQKNTSHRLLRLVLTDGVADIPAYELSTLRIFKSIPIPGEKLLIKSGTEIRNGAIIMTEENTVPLGGEVAQLKQEFLAHRRQMESGFQATGGLEGVPRFEPLNVGQHYSMRAINENDRNAFRGGGNGAGARPPQSMRGGGAGYDQGSRGRGRGGGNRGGRGRGGGDFDASRESRGRGRGRGHRGGDGRGGGRGGRGRGYGGDYHNDPNHGQNAMPTHNAPTEPRPPAFNEVNYPSLW